MKILIVAVHFEVTGARYITDAFKRLGHEVRHIGPQVPLKQAWGVDIDAKYAWEPDGDDTAFWKWCKEGTWLPDLIVIADTVLKDWVPPHPLMHTPLVFWSNDNHVRNVRRWHSNHYFLAHFHGPAQPVSQPDETWLPCATDATIFTPSPIAWEKRKYDVSLVGVMYPNRTYLLDKIEAAGYKVFRGTGLVYEEYRDVYHDTRISLCVSAAGDVAQRVFETAGMGCLVLTDPLLDLRDGVTRTQLDVHGFGVYQSQQDADELLLRVKDFIELEPDMAKFGASQLQAKVLAKHTWDKRAQVVVEWYEKNYQNKFQPHPNFAQEYADKQHQFLYGQPTPGTLKEVNNGAKMQDEQQALRDAVINHLLTTPDNIPESARAALEAKSEIHRLRENGIDPSRSAVAFMSEMKRKPYLNLGCGKTHLPSAPPPGHETVDPTIYSYPLWTNVDKVEGVGADKTFDLFTYPWPLEDNSYDGALLAHICEHIPHEIKLAKYPIELDEYTSGASEQSKRWSQLSRELPHLQDGWYAFFSELYRVLTPGAIVHIVSPYGFSDGGITDPTHTRYLTLNTFTHSMTPNIGDGSTFQYANGGINFVQDAPEIYRLTPMFKHLMIQPDDLPAIKESKVLQFQHEIATRINVCYDFYIKLRVVK